MAKPRMQPMRSDHVDVDKPEKYFNVHKIRGGIEAGGESPALLLLPLPECKADFRDCDRRPKTGGVHRRVAAVTVIDFFDTASASGWCVMAVWRAC